MVVEDLSELQLYINLLESQKEMKYKDFQKLLKDLKYEFNIDVTMQDLNNLYSATIEEEEEDLRMIYNRLY